MKTIQLQAIRRNGITSLYVKLPRQRKLHCVASGPMDMTPGELIEHGKNILPCWWAEYAPALYLMASALS